MSNEPIRNVVIVGAGFGGLSAAKELAKTNVNITLIDRQNHHLFQPLLYQVATSALTSAEIAVPIRSVLRHQKNAKVLMDEVIGVDKDSQTVKTGSGLSLPYDTLILATGAQHSYFGNDQWAEFAPGLKTLNDAHKIRRKVLAAFEQIELVEDDPARIEALQTFVVIGAGPTGVELAGAIAELAHSVASDFRNIDAESTRIILVEGGPRVLPSFHLKLSDRARRDLTRLGVDVRTDTMVSDIKGTTISTNGGSIHAETIVWAAGVQASPAAKWLDIPSERAGHVKVDETLRPEGLENVYVIGDTAMRLENDKPLPGIAPTAKQMGIYVGKRIKAEVENKKEPKPFRYSDAGALATIGRNSAVADIYGLRLQGFIGWMLWGIAHVYFLIGFKNRLFVMLSWAWSYVTWQKGVRLIVRDPKGAKPMKEAETPRLDIAS